MIAATFRILPWKQTGACEPCARVRTQHMRVMAPDGTEHLLNRWVYRWLYMPRLHSHSPVFDFEVVCYATEDDKRLMDEAIEPLDAVLRLFAWIVMNVEMPEEWFT